MEPEAPAPFTDRDFFARPTVVVAGDLLGMWLMRRTADGLSGGPIVETEAYGGPEDLASHARAGRTARTAPMFGEVGHAYVYLVYGIHECLNVVAYDAAGGAEAGADQEAGRDHHAVEEIVQAVAHQDEIARRPRVAVLVEVEAVHETLEEKEKDHGRERPGQDAAVTAGLGEALRQQLEEGRAEQDAGREAQQVDLRALGPAHQEDAHERDRAHQEGGEQRLHERGHADRGDWL